MLFIKIRYFFNCTYIGVNNVNLKKRLAQHNGEICGGATQNQIGPEPILTVSGFFTKNQALSFEYRVKKKIVKTN